MTRRSHDSEEPIADLDPTYFSIGSVISGHVDGATTRYFPHDT